MLSSRGNETSKAAIQRGVGGREIPLQTHLSEQLLKWKCRSSETFEFPPIAREEEGGRRERGLLSHANSNAGAHSGSTQPAARRGFVREFIRTSTNTGKLAARGSRFTGKAMNGDSSI